MRSFIGRDILSLKDFERDDYTRIFEVCEQLAPHAHNRRNCDLCKDKTLLTAFYQPSTRTRMSTEAAMHRLGGHVLGFADSKMTRAGDFYQESIKDTVRMLEYYADVIAMRHYQLGAPHEAAKYSSVPIINCGDGWGEHPTQVLTDLYTIWRERGTLDGLRWLCVGDHRMRTMHSIGHAATQWDMELDVVYPPDMAPTAEFKQELRDRNVRYNEWKSTAECIEKADVIYIEPVVQADYTKSRVDSSEAKKGTTPPEYQITRKMMLEQAKRNAIILHSLPRMDELPVDVDSTRHARYWIEAANGVVLRMALIALTLGRAE